MIWEKCKHDCPGFLNFILCPPTGGLGSSTDFHNHYTCTKYRVFFTNKCQQCAKFSKFIQKTLVKRKSKKDTSAVTYTSFIRHLLMILKWKLGGKCCHDTQYSVICLNLSNKALSGFFFEIYSCGLC